MTTREEYDALRRQSPPSQRLFGEWLRRETMTREQLVASYANLPAAAAEAGRQHLAAIDAAIAASEAAYNARLKVRIAELLHESKQ